LKNVSRQSFSLSGIIWFSGGGTGFVGTAFSKLLRSKGYGVNIVSRMPGPQRISWVTITNKLLELICMQSVQKINAECGGHISPNI
jgi:NAD dependent epimerase/dehydratase family enzyme